MTNEVRATTKIERRCFDVGFCFFLMRRNANESTFGGGIERERERKIFSIFQCQESAAAVGCLLTCCVAFCLCQMINPLARKKLLLVIVDAQFGAAQSRYVMHVCCAPLLFVGQATPLGLLKRTRPVCCCCFAHLSCIIGSRAVYILKMVLNCLLPFRAMSQFPFRCILFNAIDRTLTEHHY
jgi:hypothetical protein